MSNSLHYIRLYMGVDYVRNCRACISLENRMQEEIKWNVGLTLTLQAMIDLQLREYM
jgi:hypothetical protein